MGMTRCPHVYNIGAMLTNLKTNKPKIVKCKDCKHRIVTKHSPRPGKIVLVYDCDKQVKQVNHHGNKNKAPCPDYEPIPEDQRKKYGKAMVIKPYVIE